MQEELLSYKPKKDRGREKMAECGKGSMPECGYFTPCGCLCPFNCMYKIERESITTATSTPLNTAATHVTDTDKDNKIASLQAENTELRERLDKAVELPFIVIDERTGKEADIYNIALNEEWANHLIYCDMEGFAIAQDGALILYDECGNIAYPPADRFEIVSEKRLAELKGEDE